MIHSDTQHPLLVTDSSSLLLEQVICQIPSSADIPRGRDRHQDGWTKVEGQQVPRHRRPVSALLQVGLDDPFPPFFF